MTTPQANYCQSVYVCAITRSTGRDPLLSSKQMNFFTADRIATLSTPILLDTLIDFSKQQAKTTKLEFQVRNENVIAMIKHELNTRAAA